MHYSCLDYFDCITYKAVEKNLHFIRFFSLVIWTELWKKATNVGFFWASDATYSAEGKNNHDFLKNPLFPPPSIIYSFSIHLDLDHSRGYSQGWNGSSSSLSWLHCHRRPLFWCWRCLSRALHLWLWNVRFPQWQYQGWLWLESGE